MDDDPPDHSGDPFSQLAIAGAAVVIACLAVALLWTWLRFGSLDEQTRQLAASTTSAIATNGGGGGGGGSHNGGDNGGGGRVRLFDRYQYFLISG